MADWTYIPQFGHRVLYGPSPTLQTTLDDGKVISRIKHTNVPETWECEFWLTGSQFDTAKSFYDSHGVSTPFTMLVYDVAGTPLQERSVRFASEWSWRREGHDYFVVTLKFVRHY